MIDHVALRSEDPGVTAAFYKQILGAPRIDLLVSGSASGPVVLLRIGNQTSIEVFKEGKGVADARASPLGLIHIAIAVDDVDATYHKALAAGATRVRPPADVQFASHPGAIVRTAFVCGPTGEILELIGRGWSIGLTKNTVP